MLKVYYRLLSKRIHIIKHFRYSFDVFNFLWNKKFFWIRDDGNTNGWLKTFVPYLTKEKKQNFLSRLDERGQKLGTILLEKIERITYNNILPYKSLFTPQEIKEQEHFARFCLQNTDNVPFNLQEVGSYLNYFYIKQFSEEHHHFDLQGKDIIDCGGYNGDSSLAMDKYFRNIGNIYCIEPEMKNFNDIKKIMQSEKKTNIIPLNIGLGDKASEANISGGGAGSNLSTDGNNGGTKIHIDIIDSIVNTHKSMPGLIKWDIEGFEYDSIVGAEQTIKKHKPMLLISIYHRGKDWFEILPLIDSWNLGYKFTLRRRNCFHPFADTLLVCY